ncbi:ribbon-helix-helix domain-containing protein [Sutterella wadsworthensis]|uniref:ribbon-helix-helix domain-containing protein n=1 Tax=Sutterella wadsworthensis TaxID=40545 RepID=UPI0019CF915C|nr:ribbon-helix-helix domain-containing protein [Sutterella wadsworthensis]
MTQPATRIANVKWNISVPPDFDEATRIYLASQGGKKGSLSSLVQKAVSRYILSSLTGESKEKVRASGLSQSELEKIIADGLALAKDQSR